MTGPARIPNALAGYTRTNLLRPKGPLSSSFLVRRRGRVTVLVLVKWLLFQVLSCILLLLKIPFGLVILEKVHATHTCDRAIATIACGYEFLRSWRAPPTLLRDQRIRVQHQSSILL